MRYNGYNWFGAEMSSCLMSTISREWWLWRKGEFFKWHLSNVGRLCKCLSMCERLSVWEIVSECLCMWVTKWVRVSVCVCLSVFECVRERLICVCVCMYLYESMWEMGNREIMWARERDVRGKNHNLYRTINYMASCAKINVVMKDETFHINECQLHNNSAI